MNVTKANRYLPALNKIAEGVTMLASAIEEAAWESFEDHPGMRGLAQSPQPSSPSQHWKLQPKSTKRLTSRQPRHRLLIRQ
ncbi:Uncharacterised protein [Trueperella pyogenes]|nr:Uncharacterised protein [Trueperella pyogenes]